MQNDEVTEACGCLCDCYELMRYLDNNVLKSELEKEIRGQLSYFKRNYTIVEREVTTTHTVRELEYNND